MIEEIFVAGFSLAIILYWVYETDVIWEYLSLGVSKIKNRDKQNMMNGILLLSAWELKRKERLYPNYLDFLNSIYNKFITKLISCQICISFFLGILMSLFFLNPLLGPSISFIGLSCYFLLKLLTKAIKQL
jgi:hypothetical protein